MEKSSADHITKSAGGRVITVTGPSITVRSSEGEFHCDGKEVVLLIGGEMHKITGPIWFSSKSEIAISGSYCNMLVNSDSAVISGANHDVKCSNVESISGSGCDIKCNRVAKIAGSGNNVTLSK